MKRQTDFQIADAALCNLTMQVRDWLEDWELLIGPAAANELHEILDEA